jgi:hypothetical protein
MTDQLYAIAKQRGKTVLAFAVMAFILCLVHPEMVNAIWMPTAGAVGALGAMEAWASKSST